MQSRRSALAALLAVVTLCVGVGCGDGGGSGEGDDNAQAGNNAANNNAGNNSAGNNAGNNANNANSANNAENNAGNNAEPVNNAGNNGQPAGEITHQSVVPEGVRPEDAVRLVVMGDSISAGVGASRDELAYFELLTENSAQAWPDEDEADLTSLFSHDVELVNVAVGGATTRSMWMSQVPALEQRLGDSAAGPTVVVITIGGNDLTTGFAGGADLDGAHLEEALAFIRNTLEFLQDGRFPDGVAIFLATVYDPGDGEPRAAQCFGGIALEEASRALPIWARRYVELAFDYQIGVVDAFGAFRGHGFYYDDPDNMYYDEADPTLWFASDCIHPNDRGHNELRRLFFEAIAPEGAYLAD